VGLTAGLSEIIRAAIRNEKATRATGWPNSMVVTAMVGSRRQRVCLNKISLSFSDFSVKHVVPAPFRNSRRIEQVANFIVSYDLNGSKPSHHEMDLHLEKLGAARGRILETVWYVGAWMTQDDLYNHVALILSPNDQLIVSEAKEATFRRLLVTSDSFIAAWNKYRE